MQSLRFDSVGDKILVSSPVRAIRSELRETSDLDGRGGISRDIGRAHNLLRAVGQKTTEWSGNDYRTRIGNLRTWDMN